MARIARQDLKIFALGAANNGVFGSAADGTKILTLNVETLQEKGAWNTGWLTAVEGTKKFPPLEEFQALNYINTYQIAYLLQDGIPEYYNLTNYFMNSVVKKPGTYQLYGSITNNNVGNALTDATNWKFLCDLANLNQEFVWCGISAGTASAMVLTPAVPATSYFAGQIVAFLSGTSSVNGGTTINLSTLGAKAVFKQGILDPKANDIAANSLYFAVYDGTQFQLLNSSTFSHGADISANTTTNLDAATGNVLSITGNAVISAITLRDGDVKICTFTGTGLIKNNSVIQAQSAADITYAPGDWAIIVGYPTKVYVNYFKADGTALIQTFSRKFSSPQQAIATAAPYLESYAHGLGVPPFDFRAFLVNLSAEGSYSPGDLVPLVGNTYPGGGGGTLFYESTYADAVNVGHTRTESQIYIANKTSGAQLAITAIKWAVVFKGFI